MKGQIRNPLLLLLTGTLVACGGGTTPAPTPGGNTPPNVSVKANGRAITTDTYLRSGAQVNVSVTDPDVGGAIRKVTYAIDGGAKTEIAPSSNIALTLPTLSGGRHEVVVEATDNQNAATTVRVPFLIDAAAPTITAVTLNGQAAANSTTYTVGDAALLSVSARDSRGDAAATAGPTLISVYEDGVLIAQEQASTLNVDLSKSVSGTARAAGTASITVLVQDSVGYTATRNLSLVFNAGSGPGETTAPTFTWLSPTADFVAGGGTITLRATAVRNGQTLTGPITYTATCGTISGSTWTLGADCTDGSRQTITATITDGGRTFSSTPKLVTIDASDPTVQITGPQQGQTFTQNPIKISVTGTDATSGIDRLLVEASTDGTNFTQVGVVTAASGDVTWAPMNGTYTLRATAIDKTGRRSTTSVSGIRVNLTSSSVITPNTPTISGTTSGSAPIYIRGVGRVSGSATSTGGISSGQLVVDGTVTGSSSSASNGTPVTFTFDFNTLNDGLHDVGIRWSDNASAVFDSPKVSVYVDKTAPVVRWNTPVSGSVTRTAPIALSATATDSGAGVQGDVTYSVGGAAVSANWTPSAEGIFDVVATATDKVGNQGTATTRLTYDRTGPVITVSSPADTQEFGTPAVTIAATATDNLTNVVSMEARITTPNGVTSSLGVQNSGTYSATYTPVQSGTYTLNFFATDGAGNTSAQSTRTFRYSVTTPPVEQAPSPVLEVVGSGPYAGNMSVNVSGNFDAASQVDRMILQVTDANGVVDNSTYTTTQARATFSVDTTRFSNGNLQLKVIAYTKTGLRGESTVKTVQVQNLTSPDLAVASPADGATVTTPTVPVRVTLTKRSADYAVDPQTIQVDILDSRGVVVLQKTLATNDPNACIGNTDSLTCNTTFDMAGLPADIYNIRVRATVRVDPSGANVTRMLETTSRFTSNTISALPPAATIRFPAITDNRTPGRIDSQSGILVSVSDDTGVRVVEARVVGPFDATKPLALNGTTQCQESQPVAGRNPVDVLMLNRGFDPQLKLADIVLPSMDIDGSAYVPDNNANERYDLRVTTIDGEANRNIQCIPITINRAQTRAERSAYTESTTTTPGTPNPISGELNYTSGTWNLSGITNRSRVAAVVYQNGGQQTISFNSDVTGSTSLTYSFGNPGTYQIVWLIEDMTTGIVTNVAGDVVTVIRNP